LGSSRSSWSCCSSFCCSLAAVATALVGIERSAAALAAGHHPPTPMTVIVHLTGHYVGVVPALLDRLQIFDKRLCHNRLLMYTQTLSYLADVAAKTTLFGDDLDLLRTPSVVFQSVLALLVLLAATTLAVYKPRGVTPYGR